MASQPQPQTLSRKVFGPHSRFCLVEFQTRFGTIEWMVNDAETPGPGGLPETVVQESDREAAIAKALARVQDQE